jgi:hypothetical protein
MSGDVEAKVSVVKGGPRHRPAYASALVTIRGEHLMRDYHNFLFMRAAASSARVV